MTATAVTLEAAKARSGLYALFCLLTAPLEGWQVDWLQRRLRRVAKVLGSRLAFPGIGAGLLDLRQALRGAAVPELVVEHERLDRLAPPYESHYRNPDGLLMGVTAGDVIRFYREAGLTTDAGWRDLPDHLWAELEFMAYLAEQEAACWQRNLLPLADRWLALEERFLKEHLTRWVPAYAARVRQAEPLGFYLGVAELLAESVRLDLQWVAGLRRHLAGSAAPAESGPAAPARAAFGREG